MGLQANSSWTTYFDVPTGPLLLHLTKSLVEKTWRTDPSVLTLWRLHRADVLTLLLISSLSAHGVATGGAWRRTSNDSLAFYCKPKLSFSSKLDRDKYHTRVSSLLSLREFLCLFLFCFVSLLVGPFIFRFKLLIFLWTLRQYKKKMVLQCMLGLPEGSQWSRFATLANFLQWDPFHGPLSGFVLCLSFVRVMSVLPPHKAQTSAI